MGGEGTMAASVARFVERLGLYFEEFGLPRIGGRLLGLLMVTDEPLSLDAIARRLLVSRASVSTNARMMLATELVERVGIPGDRRDYYAFNANAWEAIVAVDQKAAITFRDFCREALDGLDDDDPAHARLDEAMEFFDFYATELAAIQARWRERRRAKRAQPPRAAHTHTADPPPARPS